MSVLGTVCKEGCFYCDVKINFFLMFVDFFKKPVSGGVSRLPQKGKVLRSKKKPC